MSDPSRQDTQAYRDADLRVGAAMLATIAAATFASSAGLILRSIEAADGWQILFFRALGFVAVLTLLILAKHGRRSGAALRATGWPGVLVALSLGVAFVAMVQSMLATTVANTVFVLAAAPFVAAGLGALLIAERPARATLIAAVGALIGVGLTVSQGARADGAVGLLWAVVACVGYAAAIVGLRMRREVDMLPAIGLSGVVAGALSLALASDVLAISRWDLLLSLALGVFQIGMQYILLTWATRHLPAARVTLLMMIEIVLAPFWVWIAFSETPAPGALTGGALILIALIGDAVFTANRRRKP